MTSVADEDFLHWQELHRKWQVAGCCFFSWVTTRTKTEQQGCSAALEEGIEGFERSGQTHKGRFGREFFSRLLEESQGYGCQEARVHSQAECARLQAEYQEMEAQRKKTEEKSEAWEGIPDT